MSDDNGPDVGYGRVGDRTVSSGARFDLPGLEEATKQVNALNDAIKALSTNLKGISSSQGQHTAGIQAIGSAIQGMDMGTGGGGYIPGANYKNTGATAGSQDLSWLSGQISQMGSNPLAAIGTALTLPIKYAFNRVEENRAVTRNLSYDLSRVSTMSGTGIEGILRMLSSQVPVLGNAEDITQAMNIGAAGGYFNMNSARSGGFYTGVRQMQQLQPGVSAPTAAGQMLGALSDTRAQQTAVMLTGGAMGMFGAGGVPKTLQEWAEGTLRWFEAQRPGANRGKAFTKEELASQVFPGSNMSAWFSATGVQPYMQDYFWQYAMGKVQSGGTTQTQLTVEQIVGQRGGDLGLATLQTKTANARRDFVMASTPGALGGQSFYQAYMTRESADRDFTNVMSQMIDKSIASLLGGILGQLFAKIPTPIAGALAQMVTSIPEMLGGLIPGDPEFMIGDAGSYGPLGGTGTAGMTPSMANRVNSMMRANPNLRITSGFRDGALQGRLHAGGVGMTAPAGKSMHGRGLAADLGPASQYGWIASNAGRFGLESGLKAGEPWHVGMPGTIPGGNFMVGDVGDWWNSITGVAKSLFSGVTSSVSGFADLISAILGGGSSKDFSIAFAKLLGAGGGGGGGGGGAPPPAGSGGSTASGGRASGPAVPASTVTAIQNKFFGGRHPMQADVSSHTAGILAALQAAQGVGFSGDMLVTMGAIAGGESVWNPGAHRTTSARSLVVGDRGEWQINHVHDPTLAAKGIIPSDTPSGRMSLFDINTNAKAAWLLSGGGTSTQPWYMSIGNDAKYVQGVYDIAKSHGFIGDPGYSPAYVPFNNGGVTQINMNNSFTVQGSTGSPADLRRTAEQLANYTSGEIRKQMARTT